MSRVLLVFIDGIGIGRPDPSVNPMAGLDVLGNTLPPGWEPPVGGGRPDTLPELRREVPLPAGGIARSTDASLGMPGLPQSATGQTTLFTGINAAEQLGHHLYGYPGPTLRRILVEHSILKRARAMNLRAAFLNAYRPLFFELGEAIWDRPMSASSWNNRAAGLPFMTLDDVHGRRALYHDFTNQEPIEKGFGLPGWSPEEAGEVLAEAAGQHDLAIYEYFLTDRVGHTGDLARARSVVEPLDRFLVAAVKAANLTEQTIVVTSDHGNLDDMSRKTHTLNPVPTLVWGPDAAGLAERLPRLEDFAGALLDQVGVKGG
ncbi:MAG: peptidase [Candidatus Eisenbacteria bacterium]|nr:peptidase [Candidatus Eisenbacteria bacterium]